MSYLDRLNRKIREDAPRGEATKGTKAPYVPFVAPLPAPSRQISDLEAFEARRQRVLAMLAANPLLRLAVVCDAEGDPVPVAVAIRDKGTCEVLIPAARFDPFGLLELVGRHGGTVQ